MKLTNGEIFQASKPLEELSKERLPLKASYRVALLIKKLSDQLSVIENVRVGLIKKYGELKEDGEMVIQPNSKNWDKFVSEMNELLAQETEIVFEKIELPAEINGEPFQIEPSNLILLEKFIVVK